MIRSRRNFLKKVSAPSKTFNEWYFWDEDYLSTFAQPQMLIWNTAIIVSCSRRSLVRLSCSQRSRRHEENFDFYKQYLCQWPLGASQRGPRSAVAILSISVLQIQSPRPSGLWKGKLRFNLIHVLKVFCQAFFQKSLPPAAHILTKQTQITNPLT